jgi:hypothetical protein
VSVMHQVMSGRHHVTQPVLHIRWQRRGKEQEDGAGNCGPARDATSGTNSGHMPVHVIQPLSMQL